MGLLGLLARNTGRIYAVTNSLLFAGAVMLVQNPTILHFDIGFQLSFLALMGLVYLQPAVEPYFKLLPKTIRKYFLPALCAQMFTLPVLATNFGQISIIGIATNVLVVPMIPLIMLLGFLTGITGLVSPVLALPFAWSVGGLLSAMVMIIKWTAGFKFSAWPIGSFPAWAVLVYYAILSLILWKAKPNS
jgi:competence protein ComEC